MKKPLVSIIIPTYNHCEDLLRPCLESIIKHTDLDDKEVIVVANGCTDNTAEYVKSLNAKYNSIKLIEVSFATGYTKATNIGIAFSSGEYLVFLNNDTVILDSPRNLWIEMLVGPFSVFPHIRVTGPLVLDHHETGYSFVVFFCAATTRKTIEEVGILDDGFSPGGCEDIDFCIRVQKKGYKCVTIPELKDRYDGRNVGLFPIYHKAEATFSGVSKWQEIFNINTQKLITRYGRK